MGNKKKTKMSQTSTTIINILSFAFLLMTTISSTNIKKNNKTINDIAQAPAAPSQPAEEERQMPATRQERLKAFINQRHERIHQEKERFEEKFNNTIQRREQLEEKFQDNVQGQVSSQRNDIKKELIDRLNRAREAVQNVTDAINNERAKIQERRQEAKNDFIKRANDTFNEAGDAREDLKEKIRDTLQDKIDQKKISLPKHHRQSRKYQS